MKKFVYQCNGVEHAAVNNKELVELVEDGRHLSMLSVVCNNMCKVRGT